MIATLSSNRYFNAGVKAIFQAIRAEVNFCEPSSLSASPSLFPEIALIIIDIHGLNLNFEETLTLLGRLAARHRTARIMLITNRISQVTVNTLRRYQQDVLVVDSRHFYSHAAVRFPENPNNRPVIPPPLPQNEQSGSAERLTKREIQVLRHLSKGKCLKKIASVTNLHAKTISHYKCSIMKKYGCAGVSDLKTVIEQLGYRTY